MTTDRQRWAVVGGGVLGMSVATGLAEAGHDVVLYEAAPALGGLASAWQLGDVVWDRHYHVILPTDRRTVAMVQSLGLEDRLVWATAKAGCQSGDRLYPASTTAEILRLPFLGLLAKLRLGLTAVRAMTIRDRRKVERVLVTAWLGRWAGRQATEAFWVPLLRSKLGRNADVTSAAFIWATIQRLVRARRSGKAGDGFGYVRGGYAAILDAYAKKLEAAGVDAVCGARVEGVHSAGASGVEVRLEGADPAVFDRAVVTVASPVAARLCPELSSVEKERCESVTYMGIVCLSLLLKRPLTEYYLAYLTDDAPFTTVVDMTALIDPAEVGGHGLVYLPRYVAGDDPLLRADEATVVQSFLPALEAMYPGFGADDVLATRLSTVRYVMPVPTLRYSERLPPVRTSVPGLYLASSAQIVDGTLNVNETLRIAADVLPVLLEAV